MPHHMRRATTGQWTVRQYTPALGARHERRSSVALAAALGPGHYDPMPSAAIAYIRDLPDVAKLGYACAQVEEVAVWDARRISITAHTGKQVVPLCFQADILSSQFGQPLDPTVPSPFFALAPQRSVWPSSTARPTIEQIEGFMNDWGIRYILVDATHPNSLVPAAQPIFQVGNVTIYELP